MKIEKIIMAFLIVFFIGGILYIQSSRKKNVNGRINLSNYGGFSIGTFDYRVISNQRTYSIAYFYVVNSNEFRGGDGYCYLDSDVASDAYTDNKKAKPGDKFLVLYDKKVPNKSIIRLDYPIKDSTDLKRYVLEFEEMRKQKK